MSGSGTARRRTPWSQSAFGARLRAVRKERGMTLRALAAAAGVHWTYLGQVERGERNVGLLTILRLAKAVGVDAGTLLKGLWVEEEAKERG